MSAGKATGRPMRQPKHTKSEKGYEQIKKRIEKELGGLLKTNQLLIAIQFAADHECEFDVSDAIAAINERVERHIETLDRLCV